MRECIRKLSVLTCSRLDSIEERQKMMLQQVFQQARSDSGAKVLISMVSPPFNEIPNSLGLCRNEHADFDDGLPPGILPAFGRLSPRQD
jgi:hypothetical protein